MIEEEIEYARRLRDKDANRYLPRIVSLFLGGLGLALIAAVVDWFDLSFKWWQVVLGLYFLFFIVNLAMGLHELLRQLLRRA